jgi:hypothetical protein
VQHFDTPAWKAGAVNKTSGKEQDMDAKGSNGHRVPAAGAQREAVLLESLSQRVLWRGDIGFWRTLFLGPACASIRFEAQQLTLLAGDAPLAGIHRAELERLATRVGGELQIPRRADMVLSFDSAVAALEAAVVLQRLSEGRRVRIAVNTVLCMVACFEVDGRAHRVVVGTEIDEAEEALAHAAAGTILVSGETHELLGADFADSVRDGVVTTEMDEQGVTQACITLAPHRSAAMSTFAGLGLV